MRNECEATLSPRLRKSTRGLQPPILTQFLNPTRDRPVEPPRLDPTHPVGEMYLSLELKGWIDSVTMGLVRSPSLLLSGGLSNTSGLPDISKCPIFSVSSHRRAIARIATWSLYCLFGDASSHCCKASNRKRQRRNASRLLGFIALH